MRKILLAGTLFLAALLAVFFFLFAFSGFDLRRLNERLPIPIHFRSEKHYTLGTLEYVNNILEIEHGEGAKAALRQIMRDVDQYPKEIDQNTEENIDRFHKLVSTMVFHIGSVDEDTHYFRNKLNRAPASLKALMDENQRLPMRKRWKLLSVRTSAYHIQGKDGEYNLKFMSYDSYREAVYNKNGVLLTEKNDPVNMGTYNYAAGIPILNSHNRFDVVPYIQYGNTKDSPQKGSIAINLGVQQAMANYKKNALSVYQYRNKLFGMQEGRVP